MPAASAAPARQRAGALGCVAAAHFVSHLHALALPPLFPFVSAELGLGFTELGLIVTLFAVATGVAQIPVGFLVDRLGPQPVLITGLLVLSLAIGAMGVVSSAEGLAGLALLAGAANSVFHPADYSILSAATAPHRLGRAFSLHTFGGHLGDSLAPLIVVGLAVAFSWRLALPAVAIIGIAVAVAIAARPAPDDARRPAQRERESSEREAQGARLLWTAPVLMLFVFFVLTSIGSSGVRTFSVAALGASGTPPLVGGAALTAYLFASALGVLVGGVLADRTARHDRLAAAAFLVTALVIGVAGSAVLADAVLISLFAIAGLCQGVIRPARDMLVRAVAPARSTGKVFAFVSTGMSVGGALAPVLFGWVVDRGSGRDVFWLIAATMLLALVTVIGPRSAAQPAAAQKDGQ